MFIAVGDFLVQFTAVKKGVTVFIKNKKRLTEYKTTFKQGLRKWLGITALVCKDPKRVQRWLHTIAINQNATYKGTVVEETDTASFIVNGNGKTIKLICQPRKAEGCTEKPERNWNIKARKFKKNSLLLQLTKDGVRYGQVFTGKKRAQMGLFGKKTDVTKTIQFVKAALNLKNYLYNWQVTQPDEECAIFHLKVSSMDQEFFFRCKRQN